MKLSLMTFMYEMPLLMEGEWAEEKSSRIEDLAAYAAMAGFEGIDLTMASVEKMTVPRVQKLLQKYGLSLASLICFAALGEPDISDEEAEAPYLKAIDAAQELCCEHLMIVPGFFVQSEDTERIRETVKRRLPYLVNEAAKKNIICMIEDDPDLKLGLCSAKDVKEVLESAPGARLVFDTANMIPAGEDPVWYYEQMQEAVVHMHIKDMAVSEDPRAYRNRGTDGTYYVSAPHGTGLVDFGQLFRSFGRSGYQGWLSLEMVPSGKEDTCQEIRRVYRQFAALSAKCTVGINEVGLIAKLIAEPYAQVWNAVLQRGAESIEICAVADHSERIRAYAEEAARKFPVGMPACLAKGSDIFALAKSVTDSGLMIHSCHLLLCEAYPELIEESVPYLKEISAQTGIRQFVISCMFDSLKMVEAFLTHIKNAAEALAHDSITLCYHNHDMDSRPLENGKTALEMVLESCPDCMIQLDVGWAWYADMDSVSFMKQYGDRIASVHLKDFTADCRERSDDGRFTAIGAGAVPTKDVLANLHLCNLAPGRLIIDQDASGGDMYDDAEFGIRFIRESI